MNLSKTLPPLLVALFCLLVSVLPPADGLYFHIAETEKKCFIEEIPDETMVMGKYRVQLYDPNTKGYGDYPNIGMHVEVKDPDEKVGLISNSKAAEALLKY